ncbi:lactoylglutathione lyase [Xylaria arbuscula]|nr:lactoylglutathione lyase [Xylaria arbuscula]
MSNRALFQVTLVVDDYDRAKAYYCGVLGFDCVDDRPQGEDKRWVVVKPGKDGAALVLAKASTDMQRASIGKQTGGRVGFFLSTDDFSRDHKNFLEKGVKFLEEPRIMPYGTVAVFEDLYGNTWDFMQPADSSS